MSSSIEIGPRDLVFLGEHAVPLYLVALFVLLALAIVADVRERRIPNWLIVAGIVGALAFHAVSENGEGIGFALGGLVTGLLMLLPLYVLRIMGAGDVKLMAMTGAFLGTNGVMGAVLASMAAGGVLALFLASAKRSLPALIRNLHAMLIHLHLRQLAGQKATLLKPESSVGHMPYAVAIAAGTLAQIFVLRF